MPKKYIEEFEGRSPTMYKDERGVPTIGSGASLNSPDTAAMLKEMGVARPSLMAGSPLTEEQMADLEAKKIQEKRALLSRIKEKDFPEFQATPEQQEVLESLVYNNPQLLGPNLRGHLKAGNIEAAAKEILLRSNKARSPGLQRRRIKEAEGFLGKPLQEMALSPEEKMHVWDILSEIENPNTRDQTLGQYEFLLPKSRFKKMIED